MKCYVLPSNKFSLRRVDGPRSFNLKGDLLSLVYSRPFFKRPDVCHFHRLVPLTSVTRFRTSTTTETVVTKPNLPLKKRSVTIIPNPTTTTSEPEDSLLESCSVGIKALKPAVGGQLSSAALLEGLQLKQREIGKHQGIRQYLKGKTLFMTGGTGFLGKVLIEKILRLQPKVGHIFLLIQPRGGMTAHDRLIDMVEKSPVFSQVRAQHGEGLGDFVALRLTAVSGTVSHEDHHHLLGITDSSIRNRIQEEVEVVVHMAANTVFDESYPTSLRTNTEGTRRVLQLTKSCRKAELMLNMSTAYVNGMRSGDIHERPLVPGDCISRELNGDSAPELDFEKEIQEGLASAQKMSLEDPAEAELKLKELGLERAHHFGWQDTYAFTKAMGEMLLYKERGDLSIAVVRPSIVESSLSEPHQGWVEGIRMADPIFLAYGKGHIRGFCGAPEGVLDLIPVDTVVNATLAAMPAMANSHNIKVFQVATSSVNPLCWDEIQSIVYTHFKNNPMLDKKGNAIEVPRPIKFASETAFIADVWVRYGVPLMFLKCKQFLSWNTKKTHRKRTMLLEKTLQNLMYFARIYRPYTFYEGRFRVDNTSKLFNELSEEDKEDFKVDLVNIDWKHFLSDVHIPGLKRFVLKGRGS